MNMRYEFVPGMDRSPKVYGSRPAKKLNIEWKVGAQHALYSWDGTWYNILKRFPAALFDFRGYVVFETRESFENCPGLVISRKTNHVNVKKEISNLPGYVCVCVSMVSDKAVSQRPLTPHQKMRNRLPS